MRRRQEGPSACSTWENELGGARAMTESLRQLIQRALLSVLIKSSEAEWLSGGALAETTYFTAVNALRRILVTIGLDRRMYDATPSLHDIITQVARDREAATRQAVEDEDAGPPPN